MITPAQMYWLTRLDGIVTLLALLASFLFVVSIIMFVVGRAGITAVAQWTWDTPEIMDKRHAFGVWLCRASYMAFPISVLLFMLLVMIPTTKEMAAILVIPKIANSEKMQAVGGKIYDLATEWLEELKPNKPRKETTK